MGGASIPSVISRPGRSPGRGGGCRETAAVTGEGGLPTPEAGRVAGRFSDPEGQAGRVFSPEAGSGHFSTQLQASLSERLRLTRGQGSALGGTAARRGFRGLDFATRAGRPALGARSVKHSKNGKSRPAWQWAGVPALRIKLLETRKGGPTEPSTRNPRNLQKG